MNIQEYLESGALETYVLGLGTESERRETERLLALYPELEHELQAIKAGIEVYASVHAVEPPAALRDKVLNAMEAAVPSTSTTTEKKKVRQVTTAPRFGYGMAAAWALFILSFGAALVFYGKWQSAEAGYQGLLAEKTQLAEQYAVEHAGYNALADLNTALNSADNQIIRLGGTAASPEASAVLAWNTQTGAVKLWAQAMPANTSEEQYQLWAIIDGKPVDAGVFDVQPNAMTMLDMKTFASAQAFAVTREPRGGSIKPTMSAMVVIGEVRS